MFWPLWALSVPVGSVGPRRSPTRIGPSTPKAPAGPESSGLHESSTALRQDVPRYLHRKRAWAISWAVSWEARLVRHSEYFSMTTRRVFYYLHGKRNGDF